MPGDLQMTQFKALVFDVYATLIVSQMTVNANPFEIITYL